MSVSDVSRPVHPSIEAPAGERRSVVEVYVWELPLRLAHWLIVGAILVLSVTGFYIGNPGLMVPGEASDAFVMGTAKAIHYWAGFALIAAVLMRLVWAFSGNRHARWDKLLPVREGRWRGIGPTLGFYMFLKRKPPAFVGHNPVAGLAYLAVYGLIAFEILSGLALYGMSAAYDSPTRIFAALLPLMGGAQTAHFLHHLVMWLLWGFVFHHVWSSILMSVEERNGTTDSIFSGYKFVPPQLADEQDAKQARRQRQEE